MPSVLLNVFRWVLWLRMWSVLTSAPCKLEKNVYSTAKNKLLIMQSPLLFIMQLQKATTSTAKPVWALGGKERAGLRATGLPQRGCLPALWAASAATLLCTRGLCTARGPQLSQGRISILDTGAHSFWVQLTWGSSKSLEKVFMFLWSSKYMKWKQQSAEHCVYKTLFWIKRKNTHIFACMGIKISLDGYIKNW